MLHKDMSIFKLLLQARVNPNIHMKSGTDLMDAINSEKIEHIKLLLEYGSKLYIKNRYNQTAV